MATAARQVETRIQNRISEMASVVDLVNKFCASHKLSTHLEVALNVSIDEALNNIISYGYGDGQEHSILVRLAMESDNVTATIEDDGKPFNPTAAPPPDLKSHDRMRGFGIHYIRTLMDDVRYARQEGLNRLEMRKRLADWPESQRERDGPD